MGTVVTWSKKNSSCISIYNVESQKRLHVVKSSKSYKSSYKIYLDSSNFIYKLPTKYVIITSIVLVVETSIPLVVGRSTLPVVITSTIC